MDVRDRLGCIFKVNQHGWSKFSIATRWAWEYGLDVRDCLGCIFAAYKKVQIGHLQAFGVLFSR